MKTQYNKISKNLCFQPFTKLQCGFLNFTLFFGFLAHLVQNTRLLTISEPKGCVNYLEHIIHNEYVFEKSILCYGTVVHKISKALDFSFLQGQPKPLAQNCTFLWISNHFTVCSLIPKKYSARSHFEDYILLLLVWHSYSLQIYSTE